MGLHHVTLGGDTINAVELATRLQHRGHSVTLLAFVLPDGSDDEAPLIRLADQHGVHLRTFTRPSGLRQRLALVRDLARFARDHAFEVVHSFGHQDTYYAFAAMYGLLGVPLVVNDYAMSLSPALPRRVPLIAGTKEVRGQAQRTRHGPAFLIEPPVDSDGNAPGAVDGSAFRDMYGIASTDLLIIMVSRLGLSMKAESLRATIEAIRLLNNRGLRLGLVGDGDARKELAERAAKINAEVGRDAILFTGALVDPRPAYAAADIVVGMGHSGLRGMAFGKPVVVAGEHGFTRLLAPETMQHFDYHGIYGVGDGGNMAPRLAEHLRPLVQDAELRAVLGAFGRRLVLERYSLASAAATLERIYQDVVHDRRSVVGWTQDAAHLARCYSPAKLRRLGRRDRRRKRDRA